MDHHKIAVYCPAKKISMHYNVRLIQWKRKVFKRIQGIVDAYIHLSFFFFLLQIISKSKCKIKNQHTLKIFFYPNMFHWPDILSCLHSVQHQSNSIWLKIRCHCFGHKSWLIVRWHEINRWVSKFKPFCLERPASITIQMHQIHEDRHHNAQRHQQARISSRQLDQCKINRHLQCHHINSHQVNEVILSTCMLYNCTLNWLVH